MIEWMLGHLQMREQYHILWTLNGDTKAVRKETELFLMYRFTYNLIRLVSYKVLPSTGSLFHKFGFYTKSLRSLA
jgi:hypothetical protein